MHEDKSLFWKNAMNFGAITGLSFIVYAVILFVLGFENSQAAGYFNYLILIAGIYLGTKQFRDNINKGIITYGNALGTGTTIALFASIILGFYMYLFMTFIDPEAIDKMRVLAEEKLMERGMPDEQIEMAMGMNSKLMTPAFISLWTIPTFTFIGFILSLITSAFLKKEGDPFETDMKHIDNTTE